MGFPVLSFFTGGGFLDIGFEQAEFDIIFTNEINKEFVKIYEYANKKKISDIRNISDINITEIKPAEKFFGVIGGPPCIDFSIAGKNKGSNGELGKLSKLFANIISYLNPTFFVFENVPNLIKRHKVFYDELIAILNHNFITQTQLLNSLDFGVPQDRTRLFIVGFNKYFFKNGLFKFPEPIYKDAKKSYNWPNISEKDEMIIKPNNIPLELTVFNIFNKLEDTTQNQDEYFKPRSERIKTVLEGDVSRKSFKRLHRYRYSPTVCYGNNEVHLHPYLNRRISTREALRIQSVPDSYILPKNVSLTNKFKLIGNGVPVKLAYELAKQIKEFLN